MKMEPNQIEELPKENQIQSDDDDLNKKEFIPSNETEPGLIYISYLPPDLTPLFIRKIFEKYGEVGRIYLQADEKQKKKIKAKYDRGSFTEGWIEMGDKKLARRLAMTFNNTLITDGKNSKFSNYLWNLKYLPRFRWKNLTERIRYEREKKKQMMRVELSQAKRETSLYVKNVETSKKLESMKERHEKKGESWKSKRPKNKFKQRRTVEEIQAEKKRLNTSSENEPRKKVLKQIFG